MKDPSMVQKWNIIFYKLFGPYNNLKNNPKNVRLDTSSYEINKFSILE